MRTHDVAMWFTVRRMFVMDCLWVAWATLACSMAFWSVVFLLSVPVFSVNRAVAAQTSVQVIAQKLEDHIQETHDMLASNAARLTALEDEQKEQAKTSSRIEARQLMVIEIVNKIVDAVWWMVGMVLVLIAERVFARVFERKRS